MKVYGLPEEIKYEPDYSNYDPYAEHKREEDVKDQLTNWLIKNGYTGGHTGEILSLGIGDGYAHYMFADSGRSSCLIHLPFGYDCPDVVFLPKKEVLRRIENNKRFKEYWKSHAD